MNVINTSSDDDNRRSQAQKGRIAGDEITTREKIATSMGLYAPSPRDVEGIPRAHVAKEGVQTRRMCKELEEMARIEADMSACDRPQTPCSQSQEFTDQTPSTPTTPASQIIKHDGPLEAPGAPRKTRLMRIHPEDWSFAHQVARRLDIFGEDTLQRRASATSETGSLSE